MANSKSAEKRARQNKKRYELKHAQRSMMRTAEKELKKLLRLRIKIRKKHLKLLKQCLIT